MRFQTVSSCRIQFLALILAGLISMPAHAEVIPGRWEKVSDLELGTPIIVEFKNGDQVEGDFEGLSESEVDIETHSARAVIPKADIQTITIQPMDGLAEGGCIGAGIGAGIMAALANQPNSDFSTGGKLYFTMIGAAVGWGLGMMTDSAIKSEPIIIFCKAPERP